MHKGRMFINFAQERHAQLLLGLFGQSVVWDIMNKFKEWILKLFIWLFVCFFFNWDFFFPQVKKEKKIYSTKCFVFYPLYTILLQVV